MRLFGGGGSVTVEFLDRPPLKRREIAARVARDIAPGSYVNLGIGLPTEVADFFEPRHGVTLHTENGMLGMGPAADPHNFDPDLINAGKQPVTETPGACYFHHADSFAMIRGRHLDVCVLGAFQVSANGDLANWHTGAPDAIPAVGGAMDLAVGARKIYATMTLFTPHGRPKLVPHCTYPLTAVQCVTRLYSDYGVFTIDPSEGVIVEESYGLSVAVLRKRTGIDLR